MGKSMNKLTTKQEKFCKSFIETGNATEAYRRSYDCKNIKTPEKREIKPTKKV